MPTTNDWEPLHRGEDKLWQVFSRMRCKNFVTSTATLPEGPKHDGLLEILNYLSTLEAAQPWPHAATLGGSLVKNPLKPYTVIASRNLFPSPFLTHYLVHCNLMPKNPHFLNKKKLN